MKHDKSQPKAKPANEVDENGLDNPAPGRDTPVANNVTGRVKFDDRGNAVWEWAVSTGAFGTDVTNTRLKKLENKSLAIKDDGAPPPAQVVAMPSTVKENRKGVTQGYSPYDSGLLVKAQAEAQRAKKKDLRRLSEWLKLREQANRNKQAKD